MAELYSLPDGWEWKKLGELCDFIRGPFGGSLKKQIFKENGNAVYEQSHAIYNQFEQIRYFIDDEKFEEMKRFELRPNSLIMSCSGTIGKVAIVPNNVKKGIINQALLMLTPNNELNNIFLKLMMESNFFQTLLSENSTGAAIANVASVKVLKDLDIPLPPLEEQKRIVAKLDNLFAKIDKAIALHQKNIDEADIFMASVLNDVFAELEEKYEKKQLNQIVIFGGKNISTLEYPNLIYFSLEDIETQTGKILNYKTVNESGVKGTAVSFDDNVVLYSKLRPYLNKVIVPNLEGCATTELVVLKPKDKLDKYFLASYLRSSNIVSFLNNDSMGAKMPRTNMKTFRNLDIPLPPLKTQQKVVSYLDEISNKMEKIKNLQKEKMQSLKALKASILDKAFKGEL